MALSISGKFMQFGLRQKLFSNHDRILAAVSGGVDSMVLVDLLHNCGLLSGIVHINYRLRGRDSDMDQELVEATADRLKTPFFVTRVDDYWRDKYEGSLQMAARTFRYECFESVRSSENFTSVATAHHLDDQAETFVLNLIKGMSAAVLTGVPVRNRNIIRPLMFLTRAQILQYAENHSIQWREDASNATDAYQRNLIRNRIIPIINEVNPSFNLSADNSKFKGEGIIELYRKALTGLKRDLFVELPDGSQQILLEPLREFDHPDSVLSHLIEAYGFTPDTSIRIFGNVQTGALFYSETHCLLMDRDRLLLRRREKPGKIFTPVTIPGPGLYQSGNLKLNLEYRPFEMGYEKSRHVIWVDPERMLFPLEWRSWQPGDRLMPAGMTGHKKVSDLLTDEKVPLTAKEQITVLLCKGKVVWVPGLRASREFSQDSSVSSGLRIEFSAA
ncbi:MAG: tRNA lysidine(34) synthetase TilS [Cyclobacteriaceae bacterium]